MVMYRHWQIMLNFALLCYASIASKTLLLCSRLCFTTWHMCMCSWPMRSFRMAWQMLKT